MTEQFKGIVESKSASIFFAKIYLRCADKILKLETKVVKCLLVPRQEVAVFRDGDQVSIITPDCGDCPAAAKNEASGNRICHIYRPNLPYIKR